MTRLRRIFFDVSYTRTQAGNVGITRTVRKLLGALQEAQAETGVPCAPVAFHTGGFRVASPIAEKSAAPGRPAALLYRWLTGRRIRALAQMCLPLPLLETAWTLTNRLTFDALSAKDPAIVFAPGDLLVLADECWNYQAWKAASLARAQGANAVLVLYDLIPLRQPQYCAPLFTRAFRPWLLKMVGNCDSVMCISRATSLDFERFCQEQGVAQPPTSHFRLGCDISAAGVQKWRIASEGPGSARVLLDVSAARHHGASPLEKQEAVRPSAGAGGDLNAAHHGPAAQRLAWSRRSAITQAGFRL